MVLKVSVTMKLSVCKYLSLETYAYEVDVLPVL